MDDTGNEDEWGHLWVDHLAGPDDSRQPDPHHPPHPPLRPDTLPRNGEIGNPQNATSTDRNGVFSLRSCLRRLRDPGAPAEERLSRIA